MLGIPRSSALGTKEPGGPSSSPVFFPSNRFPVIVLE